MYNIYVYSQEQGLHIYIYIYLDMYTYVCIYTYCRRTQDQKNTSRSTKVDPGDPSGNVHAPPHRTPKRPGLTLGHSLDEALQYIGLPEVCLRSMIS